MSEWTVDYNSKSEWTVDHGGNKEWVVEKRPETEIKLLKFGDSGFKVTEYVQPPRSQIFKEINRAIDEMYLV